MKKLALSICGAVLAFGVNAEEATETTTTNKGATAVSSACDCFEGLYAGLGLSVSKAGVKTETTRVFVNGMEVGEAEGIDTHDHDVMFFGTCIFGYDAKLDDRVHLALEGMLDIGPNSNFNHAGVQPAEDNLMNVTSRQSGLIPSIGVKLGYVPRAMKSMLYLKAAVAWIGAKTRYIGTFEYETGAQEYKFLPADITVRCSKLTPLIAIGVERFCQNDFRTRFEIEYRFSASEKRSYQPLPDVSGGHPAGWCDKTIKVSSKGAITLRAMAVFPL